MKTRFIKIIEQNDVDILSSMAAAIWRECYASILTSGQIEYMLSRFLSPSVLCEHIETGGYEYFFIECDDNRVGFVGVRVEDERLFLSKLYIKSEYRGKGLSRETMKFLEDKCAETSLQAIYLTVNKYNDRAYRVYLKAGFEVIDDVVSSIGEGYVMDDYVMQKNIK